MRTIGQMVRGAGGLSWDWLVLTAVLTGTGVAVSRDMAANPDPATGLGTAAPAHTAAAFRSGPDCDSGSRTERTEIAGGAKVAAVGGKVRFLCELADR
ncbi:hypothetical protein [Jannaschia sp. W003]|uniref:hypothetical protein n=1 Tax=Jannaschia sp. W003 TaxID=2867012 RepID=UPI0021A29DAF|nr:hypothetical protein [Jannaschia sp. W003]UWQ21402.1 hypothetical protein K3554_15755 [Jannaschia sp. W003]